MPNDKISANELLAGAAHLAGQIHISNGQTEALNAVVPLYLAQNDVDTAAELANAAENDSDREALLTGVIIKCAELDDDEYALQLIDAIDNKVSKNAALEALAVEKARKYEFEKALDLTGKIAVKSSVYGFIASQMDKNGDEAGALNLLERVTEPEDKSNYLQVIALEKYKNGEPEKALNLLEEAYSETQKIDYSLDKIAALHSVSYSFGEIGRRDRSIEVLSEIQRIAEGVETFIVEDETSDDLRSEFNIAESQPHFVSGLNVNDRDRLMAEVSVAFFEAGSVDLADRALDKVTDQTQIASVLVSYAREYWRRGEKSDALDALHEAYGIIKSQHDKNTRDSEARFRLFKLITIVYAEFEQAETAIEAAASIPFDGERAQALVQIAQTLVLQGNDEAAKKAISDIDEESNRAYGWIAAAISKDENGDQTGAVKYLDSAGKMVINVLQPLVKIRLYTALAKYYAKFGETEKAREAAMETLLNISQIKFGVSRAVALAELSEIYRENNLKLTDREEHILQMILDDSEW